MKEEIKKGDLFNLRKPIHQLATCIYKTKDEIWYQLHASMNAAPTMTMLGIEEQDVTVQEAAAIYATAVA